MTIPAVFFFLALVCVAVSSRRPLKGVAESGAEWGVPLPGTVDKTYVWPRSESIEYFRNIGAGVVRVPFLWERLQPRLNGGFNPAYLAALDNAVAKITEANMSAVIDPHNYARFCPGNEAKHGDPSGPCEVIGASRVSISDFAEGFWGKLAAHFVSSFWCFDNKPFIHSFFGVLTTNHSFTLFFGVSTTNHAFTLFWCFDNKPFIHCAI